MAPTKDPGTSASPPLARSRILQDVDGAIFDAVVIGGGITGLGIALDASLRGLSVALFEREDYAAGTTSRSSKLIHGGLRYLAQGQFAVTRESLVERQHLLRLAPGLVREIPFVIPVRRGPTEAARYALGLAIYRALAPAGSRSFAHIDRSQIRDLAPWMDPRAIDTGFVYWDAQTDDVALAMAVYRRAREAGALLVNHCAVTRVTDAGGLCEINAHDREGGSDLRFRARCVVVASGAWGDRDIGGLKGGLPIQPAKGVHLLLSTDRFPMRAAMYLPTVSDDRMIFVVPWLDRILVGTTDTLYEGDIATPEVEEEDLAYLLEGLRRHTAPGQVRREDVVAAHAGIRPLVAGEAGSTSKLSRAERVKTDDRIIHIGGGKLTTYRRIAERVGSILADRLGARTGPVTLDVPLVRPTNAPPCARDGVPCAGADFDRLLLRYGGECDEILRLMPGEIGCQSEASAVPPLFEAEVRHAVQREQAMTLIDVLDRRTRLLALDHRRALALARPVASLMASDLAWTEGREASEVNALVRHARAFGLPEWRA